MRLEVRLGWSGPDAERIANAALAAGLTPTELVSATIRDRYGLRTSVVDKTDTIGPRLVAAHAAGMHDQEIADLIGVHMSTVRARRKALGLTANYRRVNMKGKS